MPDWIEDAFRKQDTERALTSLTIDHPSPEAAGKANRLARQVGVPADTADRNLSALEREVRLARAKGLIEQDPALARWASDPRNAAVGIDDMQNLAKLSKGYADALTGMTALAPQPRSWKQFAMDLPGNIAGSLYAGVAATSRGLTATAKAAVEVQDAIDPIGWADYALTGRVGRGGRPGGPKTAAENEMSGVGLLNRILDRQQGEIDRARPKDQGFIAKSVYSGIESIPASIAALVNPVAGLSIMGTSSGGQSYDQARKAGLDPLASASFGARQGTIEVATEALGPAKWVAGLKTGSPFLKRFLGYVTGDVAGEEISTVVQNFDQWATIESNQGKSFGDFLGQLPEDMAQTAIAALTTGAITTSTVEVATKAADRLDRKINRARVEERVVQAIDAAADNATRKRDPEAFRQLMEIQGDGANDNIFIPAEKVAAYFQSNEESYREDSFWSDYADQIDEGLATGGDIVIPTSAASAYLPGTPVWDAVKADVRASPGGVSAAEAEEFDANRDEAISEMALSAAEQMQADQQADAPRQRIYQDVRDKLTNAGFTQDAAHLNAELTAQRLATRAARLGKELTGDESGRLVVNQVLPPALAPIVAAAPGSVKLKAVISVMRGGVTKQKTPTLLDWIAKQGGIEDRGGDIAAMGAAPLKGIAAKGARKLIRAHADLAQGSMLGADGQQNTNSPDELALRAQEAGYFPAGGRPTVNDLFAAIDQELRGTPVLPLDASTGAADAQKAADELYQLLDQSGLDPAKATDAEIGKAIDAYRQQQEGDYQQTFSDGPRGQISFREGKSIIDLFQARNMSTFAHEMGHDWLEQLREDAQIEGADAQIAADWQAVQDWFKSNGHPTKDGQIPVDAHELWARGIERFLMEGKSPSGGLRRVFDAFRSWLLNIYQVVDNLRSPITPEIRDVMGRLLATDDEIAQATEQQAISSLFSDAAAAGMSEQEFAAYQAVASEARTEAHDALLYRTMQTIRQSRTKAWKDEERGVRADVSEQVNRRSEFKALHLLRTGRMLDDPEAPAIKVKLDRQQLIDTYGDGILGTLPKGVPPLYAETGMHFDEIAELVGFTTGDEMIRTLVTIEERTRQLRDAGDKRSVRQVLIDEEATAVMRDRHGDPLNDGSIEEEALAAVHNDRQGEVIASELRALSRRTGGRPTPYAMAREWARGKIAEGTVTETTSGAAIQRYSRAAAKASRAAEKAMLAQDVEETYRQKQAQMLNNALIAEAGRVREQVEAAVARLGGYARRRTMASMDQDYLEQIHALLEQVEFRNRSQTSIDRQESFEEWARAREAEGHDIIVPASFAASLGTTNWTRLTVEKLLGLDDTVKQIAHLGRLKQKLIDGAEDREYAAVVGEALGQIDNLPPRPPSDLMEPGFGDRLKAGVQNIDAALLKMETIVDWLDGKNPEGVFNRVVFKPIADAQTREAEMTADYFGRIRALMEAVPAEDAKRWADKVTVPEFLNRETGNPFVMTRQGMIAVALNMGNEGNIQRLTDGYGWRRDSVMEALNREMSAGEWQFVQNVWDTIDTLWPEIAAMERRINGVEPEKVKGVPIETAAGMLRGGYYPAIYDSARSIEGERQAGKSTDLLEATYTKATTRASSTKDRSAKVSRPILLQLGVINRHLGEVIHDITHREAIMNADRFLSDKRIGKAIDDTLGSAVRKQFRPWLQFVANQWAMERSGNEGIGKFINRARANTTAVGMGFRVSTIMMQIAGYSNSFEAVGAKWVSAALLQTTRNPRDTWRFVTERSGEVRGRMENLDRDIGIAIRQIAGKRDLIADAKRFAFHGIGYADRMVVVPTWIGAYNKAIAGGAAEEAAIYEADKAVRQSQGAGAAKDMAAIQRGTGKWGELLKISTMFYSYMSAFYQRERNLGRDVSAAAQGKDLGALPDLLARAWWLIIVPPVLSELLAGRGPDDEEDWGLWSFKKMMFQMLGPLPFVRDLAEPVWNGIAGKQGFGYQMSPLQRAGDTIAASAKDVGKLARGEETTKATKNAMETTGYVTGAVPGQIATATQFLVDVGQGEQNPQTAGEWWRGLTTGKTEPR